MNVPISFAVDVIVEQVDDKEKDNGAYFVVVLFCLFCQAIVGGF
jgi:hypothetical protein